MARFRLCELADIDRGDGVIRVAGPPYLDGPLAVVRSDNEIFCIDDTCTHQEASLSEGWVEGGCIECPLHESRFDLRTGAPDVPPAKDPIRTHTVAVTDGTVYLVMDDR